MRKYVKPAIKFEEIITFETLQGSFTNVSTSGRRRKRRSQD